MRVFITGGTGFIGSAVVHELIAAGHEVTGLARSHASAHTLADHGVTPVRGSLEDSDLLQDAARHADGVVHVAFSADFDDFAAAVEIDRRAVVALGEALVGTGRPLVIPSGTALMRPGTVLAEDDHGDPDAALPRREVEQELLRLSCHGVRGSIVRLGTAVHGPADTRGFVPGMISIAREKRVSAYVGDGQNRWPAVHQLDAARLFRMAAESAPAGAILHGVDDTAIPFRQIAESIGRRLGVPSVRISADEAEEHFAKFGAVAFITGADIPASSRTTRATLGWQPRHPGLLADIEEGFYFRR